MTVSIIEHSYGKPYISMDKDVYETFSKAKTENYQTIYNNPQLNDMYNNNIRPMFHDMYEALLTQAKRMDQSSILYNIILIISEVPTNIVIILILINTWSTT